jgi:hypothetical protein
VTSPPVVSLENRRSDMAKKTAAKEEAPEVVEPKAAEEEAPEVVETSAAEEEAPGKRWGLR